MSDKITSGSFGYVELVELVELLQNVQLPVLFAPSTVHITTLAPIIHHTYHTHKPPPTIHYLPSLP